MCYSKQIFKHFETKFAYWNLTHSYYAPLTVTSSALSVGNWVLVCGLTESEHLFITLTYCHLALSELILHVCYHNHEIFKKFICEVCSVVSVS